MTYVLYNPLSGNGEGGVRAQRLREELHDKDCIFTDVRLSSEVLASLLSTLTANDCLILSGGDGTLHRFLNALPSDFIPPCAFFLFPTGVENRFYSRHSKHRGELLNITAYLKDLPMLKVGTRTVRILNGVGIGLDAFVREEIRKHERHSEEPLPFRTAHLKGMLLKNWKDTAKVWVDGERKELRDLCFCSFSFDRRTEGGLLLPKNKRGTEGACAVVALSDLPFYRVPRALRQMRGQRIPSLLEETWYTVGREVRVELSAPRMLVADGELLGRTARFEVRAEAIHTDKGEK